MNTFKKSKINNLLQVWPHNAVVLTEWLKIHGVDNSLKARYQKSGWIESLGVGAVKRAGDDVDIYGALYALQKQAGINIHVAAMDALALQGLSHYLKLSSRKLCLFGKRSKVGVPKWFWNNNWGMKPDYHQTSFLKSDKGFVEHEHKGLLVNISSPERAILECLYLSPKYLDLVEVYRVFEGLNNLRPKVLQTLLKNSSSVKVNRLFLFMAKKINHSWLSYLDAGKINLGTGGRLIVRGGYLDSEFNITMPEEFKNI